MAEIFTIDIGSLGNPTMPGTYTVADLGEVTLLQEDIDFLVRHPGEVDLQLIEETTAVPPSEGSDSRAQPALTGAAAHRRWRVCRFVPTRSIRGAPRLGPQDLPPV